MSSVSKRIVDLGGRDVPKQFMLKLDGMGVSRKVSIHGVACDSLVDDLLRAFKSGNIQTACVLGSEMIASGWFNMFKSIVLEYTVKHLGVYALPDFLEYVMNRFKYLDSVKSKNGLRVVDLHKNQEYRNFTCHISAVMCILPRYKTKFPSLRDITVDKSLQALSVKYINGIVLKGSKSDIRHTSASFGHFVHYIMIGDLARAAEVAMEAGDITIKKCNHFTVTGTLKNSAVWAFWAYLYSRLGECKRDKCAETFESLRLLFNKALDKDKLDMAKYTLYTMIMFMFGEKPKMTVDLLKIRTNSKVLCMGLSSNMYFKYLKKELKKSYTLTPAKAT